MRKIVEHKIISPTYGEKVVKIDFKSYVEICRNFKGFCIQSTNRKKEGQNPTLYPVVYGEIDGRKVVKQVHRAIFQNIPPGYVVDHLNGDTFDNRLCNLEIVTRAENTRRSMKKIKLEGRKRERIGRENAAVMSS